MPVDFAKLKEQVNIDQVVQMLGLKITRKGNQMRGACPTCKGGGDRALAINADGRFYCFTKREGGDLISLTAHVRGTTVKEAAEHIADHFRVDTVPSQVPRSPKGLPSKGLDYLDPLHEDVEKLGVNPATADLVGLGFASKGFLRGRVGVPLRTEDGDLLGYYGIAPGADVIFHKSIEENADNIVEFKKPA